MIEFILTGAALGLAAGISPGPILALVVAQTLRYGRREGIIVAFTPLLSDIPIIAVSLFLLSRIQNTAPLMAAISFAGALFLCALGVESIRAKPLAAGTTTSAPRSFSKAVTLNLLNPHVYLFWSTVGAPMVLRGFATGIAAPAGFLAVFYLGLVGSKIAVAAGVGQARHALAGRGYVNTLRVLGAVMFVLAAWLIREGLHRIGLIGS